MIVQNPYNNESSDSVWVPSVQVIQLEIALRKSKIEWRLVILNNYIVCSLEHVFNLNIDKDPYSFTLVQCH